MILLLLIITLLVGTLLSFQTSDLSVSFSLYYALAIFILRSFFYGDDFFLTFQGKRAERVDQKIIVAGHEISSNVEGDKQEDRFLNLFESTRMAKRKGLNFIFFIGSWFFLYKSAASISLNTIVPILCGFLIINSFYVGHLLLVMLLNILLVILNYSSEMPVSGYLLYLFLVICSLFLISNHRAVLGTRKIMALGLVSLLFSAFCFGFSWVLPDSATPKNIKSPLLSAPELKEFLFKSKKSLSELKATNPDLSGHPELASELGQALASIDEIKNSLKQVNLSEQDKILLRQKIKDLMAAHKSIQGSLEDLQQRQVNANAPTAKELDILKGVSAKGDGKLTTDERDTIQSLMNRTDGSGEGKGLEKVKGLLDKETLTMDEKELLTESLQQVLKEKKSTPKNKADLQTSVKEDNNLLKLIVPEKEKPSFIQRFKRFLPLLVGVFLFLIINYFFRKKGIKKIEISNPEILNELKNDWKALRRLKLSPHDEVVHFYNLFHISVQKIHYSGHEAPPSCIIYEDMKLYNAELDKATLIITEIFAQCFYGQKNVTTDALKLFRKALNRILTVYELN